MGGKVVQWSLVMMATMAALGFQPSAAIAAESNTAGVPLAQGLTISPAKIEIPSSTIPTVTPGQQLRFPLTITNPTGGLVIATPQIDDFVAKSENGTAQAVPPCNSNRSSDCASLTTPFSMYQWFEPLPQLQLVSHQTVTLNVVIDVPKDAEPGGHYAVIELITTPGGANGSPINVAQAAGVGELVFLTIPGPIKQDLRYVDFYGAHDNSQTVCSGQTSSDAPNDFISRVRNDGSVHERPTGNITVHNLFGSTVDTLPVNQKAEAILPNSIRHFDSCWQNSSFLFGRYTANVDLTYADGKHVTTTVTFWVVPWQILSVLFLLIVVVLLGGWRVVVWYNHRIVRKYQHAAKR